MNVLQEIKTTNDRTYTKDYINGIGMDNLIAYDQEEMNLTTIEKPEYDFCVNRVLSFSGEFVQYGWTGVVNRCSELDTKASDKVTNRYYFHKDHLGSVVGLTDGSGSTVIEYAYDSFGKTYARSGSGIFVGIGSYTGSLYDNDRLYTGREYDGEIGLYYYRARYYSPELGRFVSRDPIGTADDINLYTYVSNNSLKFTDPSGKAKAMIVIWQEKTPWEFDAGALYQYEQYIKQGYKPKNIVGWYASTAEEFNALVHKYGNIASVTFISHGTTKTLWADHNNPMIGEGNVQNLTSITNENGNMCINTTVTVVACHAGEWENSIAQQVANRLDVSVTANDSYIGIFDKPKTGVIDTYIAYPVAKALFGSPEDWEPSTLLNLWNWRSFSPNK